jgi:hypothetical protein
MWKSSAGLLCVIGSFALIAQADEANPPTAEEVERELVIVEAYLIRNQDKPPVDAKSKEATIANLALANVVRNIGRLPEGSLVRVRAIALARKYAAIPEYAAEADLGKQKRPERVDYHQAHARLDFAWCVLRETGVLREGMRLEELVALLGPPTKIRPDKAVWYYNSPMHVNPCLLYWSSDGPEKHQKKGRLEFTSN